MVPQPFLKSVTMRFSFFVRALRFSCFSPAALNYDLNKDICYYCIRVHRTLCMRNFVVYYTRHLQYLEDVLYAQSHLHVLLYQEARHVLDDERAVANSERSILNPFKADSANRTLFLSTGYKLMGLKKHI